MLIKLTVTIAMWKTMFDFVLQIRVYVKEGEHLCLCCRFQKNGRRCLIFILMGYRDTYVRFESFEAWIDDEDEMSSLKTTIAFTNLHRDFPYWDTNIQGVWAQTHATDKRMLWVVKLELTTKTKWVRWRWRLLSLTCIKISHIDSGKFQLVLINN